MTTLVSAVSRAACAWWYDATERLGRLPARRDFDPTEHPKLLPHVFLMDVEPEGRFRIRLNETYITDLWGHEPTGRYLDQDNFGPRWSSLRDLLEETAAGRRPLATHERVMHGRGFALLNEVVHLPLAQDGGAIDMVLGTLVTIERGAGARAGGVDDHRRMTWSVERKF